LGATQLLQNGGLASHEVGQRVRFLNLLLQIGEIRGQNHACQVLEGMLASVDHA
jgi:hypothetical protein